MVTVSDEGQADKGSSRHLSGYSETTGGAERASRATCSATEGSHGFVVRKRSGNNSGLYFQSGRNFHQSGLPTPPPASAGDRRQ